MSWNGFEQKIWRQAKEWPQEIFLNSWVIAVSGGLDSIVLLYVIERLSKALKINFEVIHFHHGFSKCKVQNKYRDQAAAFAKRFTNDLDKRIKYTEIKYSELVELTSEAGFRSFRKGHLKKVLKQNKVIAIGHHQDDILETRIIRSIRGTGTQGLNGMKNFESPTKQGGSVIRPLIEFSRGEIAAYAKQQKLDWVEDPSNLDTHYLRNWIRNIWLPALEGKRPGSVNRLAKSMSHFASKGCAVSTIELNESEDIQSFSRQDFRNATKSDKKQTIATIFLKLNIENYSENQILEVVKRLDTIRSRLTFQIAGMIWVCDAQQVTVRVLQSDVR